MPTPKDELTTLLELRAMRKHVWVPGGPCNDDKFIEMKDGAVPMWFIEERIQQLLKERTENIS